jgi:pimeloyl-ACP methyl ester carboxylesterase
VYQLLSEGKHIQEIVDSPQVPSANLEKSGKYFDIISFDPRGVNNTTPRLKCFPDAFNQQAWLFKSPDYSLLWETESLLGLEWARAKTLGESCSREKDKKDMVRYANTAQVVEDMVEIIERHGEWRQQAAIEIVRDMRSTAEYADHMIERTAWHKGQEKLQYWGFSYGTLLGSTFAAMHPDRVGRVVLDGLMNPQDYYKGIWLSQLQDSDKIITKFCEYCFTAGRERCPLYTGSSAKNIETRLEQTMMNLKDNPIPVPATETQGPEVVLFGDIYLRLLSAMYFSYEYAESFFHLLSELDSANITSIAVEGIASGKQSMVKAAELSPECQKDGLFSDACVSSTYISGIGPSQAISCMDAGGGNNLTKDKFRSYLTELHGQSRWLSRSWARNKIACIGYTVQPAWTFEGLCLST